MKIKFEQEYTDLITGGKVRPYLWCKPYFKCITERGWIVFRKREELRDEKPS